MVQLDAQGAAGAGDRDRLVEPAVLLAQPVQQPQRLPGEVAQFGVVPLAFKFADDDQRDDDVVLGELQRCARIGQQHAGVQHVGADGGFGGEISAHRRPSCEGTGRRPSVRHARR